MKRRVLLTTNTPHHLYYAWQVAKQFPWSAIVIEECCLSAPFEVNHPFEKERDDYERTVLLKGGPERMEDIAATHKSLSINDSSVLDFLKKESPDLVIDFGTGKVMSSILKEISCCLNLHGGNPESYRGLDSHLWAIYHKDFQNLMTTLHSMEADLDTGDIIKRKILNISPGMKIHELRALNTKICVDLTLDIFDMSEKDKKWEPIPQKMKGRYYSFMPRCLKDICTKNFQRYVSQL